MPGLESALLEEWERTQKLCEDPRVTRIGRFLRPRLPPGVTEQCVTRRASSDGNAIGSAADRRALVIDRHRLFADAVRQLLEDMGLTVSTATLAEAAGEAIRRKRPKLTLVDLSMPAGAGFVLGKQALAARRDAVVIGITATPDPQRIREGRRAGFWGCLSKDIAVSSFASQIRSATQGRPILELPRDVQGDAGSHPSISLGLLAPRQLTARELDVLALLVDGAPGGQIARELQIRPNTVRTHVQSILTKIQVHSRLEAAAVAVRLGLVPDRSSSRTGVA